MANLRPESNLSARQRFAMILVLVLAMASFCTVLWKSRRQQQPLTRTEQVTLTEFQTIPPASATHRDTASGKPTGPREAEKPNTKPKNKKKTKSDSRKEGTRRQSPAAPPRDITSETVSPQ